MDVWEYIEREKLELPSHLLRAHPPGGHPPRRHRAGDCRWSQRGCHRPSAGENVDRPAGAFPHRRRHYLHRAGRIGRRHRRRDHRRNRHHHASPNAARPAWTTRPATPRWNNARRKAISDVRPRIDPGPRPAALSDLRQRRRRQEHADRPPAVRHQDHPRRHPVGHRQDLAKSAASAPSTCRCSPTACRPSANRASPSTSPTATSPPARASTSSPTRRATSSTRATWSPPPRPPTWRSS